ncbi:MAG: methionyl-tRNA formyltransferase, partial [Flavobacteriales bacterium]
KLKSSAIKKLAVKYELKVLQPKELDDPSFIKELKEINPKLGVIVAFRMLPEQVWSLPELGSINLHASLLPMYRGAAPINWAIMNGEEKTGVTTFFLKHKLDTGDILDKKEVAIENTDTAGVLHEKLKKVGASLLSKSVKDVLNGNYVADPQEKIESDKLKKAPKIHTETCKINWRASSKRIYDHIRGLNPYPGAWTILRNVNEGKELRVKIFDVEYEISNVYGKTEGEIYVEGSSFKICASDGYIIVREIQPPDKKKMDVNSFLNGYSIT